MYQCSARDVTCCQRHRHSESVHRAPLRLANAPDGPAAAGGRSTQSFGGPVVWYCIIGSRNCLSRCCSQSTREPAGAWHFVVLFVFLHSAQEEVASMHSGRSVSGCHAAADWVGCSIRTAQLRRMDALLRVVPLAVPAL